MLLVNLIFIIVTVLLRQRISFVSFREKRTFVKIAKMVLLVLPVKWLTWYSDHFFVVHKTQNTVKAKFLLIDFYSPENPTRIVLR